MRALSALSSLVLTLGIVGGIAHARPQATYRWIAGSKAGDHYTAPSADTVSHVIFMNRCTGGCTLSPGDNDSTTNHSSIVDSATQISAYSGSDANWQALVACVKQTYAPFNVTIVDTRPASGDYHMAIVAGTSAQAGEPSGVLGVSPFTCGYIPNSISFTFANEEPTNIDDLCWTVSQETSHSWGLDHKYDDRDPMTYLETGPAMKTFQNSAGACGEYSARTCNCTYDGTGDAQENSYAVIMSTFGGSAPDTTPPSVTITAPTDGSSVQAGFAVRATITYDQSVAKAELSIDGGVVGSPLTAAPWVFNAPTSLGQGSHHVVVTAWDGANNTATDAVDVTIGAACTKDSDCTTSGDVCTAGHCVAGPTQPGGLGTTCSTNADCDSNQCADDGTNKYCVEPCDPTMHACPSGFGCVATSASAGVCWPGADSGGGGGGCNTSGDSTVPIALTLGLGALLISRRKRATR